MKPRAIMAEDVNVVQAGNEGSRADAIDGEILKRDGNGELDDNCNEGWSTCSMTRNCCKALVRSTTAPGTCQADAILKGPLVASPSSDPTTTSPIMSSSGSNSVKFPNSLEEIDNSNLNHNETNSSINVQPIRKALGQKKPTPVKLMRTPSLVIKKRTGVSRSASSEDRREDLDAHLMGTTLKNIKFMAGPKFTIFNDVAFQRECLEAHNKVRHAFGSPTLSWCQELADEADAWAQTVAKRGRILYKEMAGVGENISLISANGSNHLPTGNEVTETWAGEYERYNYSKPAWSEKCQHFTQLVWKRTREFGVSRVWLPSKSLVAIVAFYAPSGNCNGINEYKDNVPQPARKPVTRLAEK